MSEPTDHAAPDTATATLARLMVADDPAGMPMAPGTPLTYWACTWCGKERPMDDTQPCPGCGHRGYWVVLKGTAVGPGDVIREAFLSRSHRP